MKKIVPGLMTAVVTLALAAPAGAASGTWDRAWGKSVDSANPGVFGICTVASSCLSGSNTTARGGELSGPFGVATDAAGNSYAADLGNNRIQKFDSAGNFLQAWGKDVVFSGEHNTGTGFEICVNPAGSAPDDVCQSGNTTTALGGELAAPFGVDTDSAGNVYVADTGNARIQKFDSAGNFLRAWGKDVVFSGEHNTGTGFEICVNPAGSAPDDVCKAGLTSDLGGEFNGPVGVATDAGSNVYVADQSNHRIQKFDSSGTWDRAWGKDVVFSGEHNTGTGFEICVNPAGSAPDDVCQSGDTTTTLGGEFNAPFGVATDAGSNVYVPDANNQRIQKFDSAGNFQRAWGKNVVFSGEHDTGTGFEICVNPAGSAPDDVCQGASSGGLGGELSTPIGVGTDAGSNVYVADQSNQRIQKFDSSGIWSRAWGNGVNGGGIFGICTVASSCLGGTTGGLGGEMSGPKGVATDSAGNAYVADGGNDRIQKFADPSGAAAAAAPSNVFTIGALKGKKLKLNVASAGTVAVTDAGASSANATAAAKRLLKTSSASGGPGTIEVTLKLTKAAKQKLRQKGKIKVKARITFTPTGGSASSQTAKLKIKK